MAGTDRTDADAPVAADANGSLPTPRDKENEAQDEREQPPATSPPSPPTGADDSGAIALGPAAMHELLERQPNGDGRTSEKSASASAQLVSGDPLLRGPERKATVVPPPKPSKPPPPPDTRQDGRAVTTERPAPPSDPGSYLPGVTGPATGQPARQASRGAHVAPRTVAPPARPPDQPVATLRPTTVIAQKPSAVPITPL